MNKELVARLAKQAVDDTRSKMIMAYENFESQLYQRFAELVVAECVTITEHVEKRYNTNRISTMDFDEKNRLATGEDAASKIRSDIRSLFHVESPKEDICFNALVSLIDYLDQEEGKTFDEIKEHIITKYDLPSSVTNLDWLILELMDEE